MKKFYIISFLIISILLLAHQSNATIITAVNGPGVENWNNAGTWDIGRLPKCGDTIVIPEGITVKIPANVDLDDPANADCGLTHIIVAGTMELSNGNRFELAAGVCIDFYDTGLLTTTGGGKGNAEVIIGGSTEWQKSDGDWNGPDNIGCINDLPVELLSFNLEIADNQVNLTFVTASEREIDYFIIESSRDGSYWQEVKTIKANGNSTNTLTYKASDDNPFNGESFYRLKDVSIDGKVSNLEIISCTFYSEKLLIYPIPVNKTMFIEGDKLEQAEISIINSLGDVIHVEKTLMGDKLSFDFEPIKSGVYFVKIETSTIKKTERIVVVRNK